MGAIPFEEKKRPDRMSGLEQTRILFGRVLYFPLPVKKL